jgi:DNA-directed RNA polymerase specialized sigma24 family protein
MQVGDVLYSRYTDGCRPVKVVENGWEVQGSDGKPVQFTTAQGLLAELTGHPKGRHWTLDRYFQQGKHKPADPMGQGSVLDLFGAPTTTKKGVITLAPLAPSLVSLRTEVSITVPAAPLGIDLINRSHEVRKLLFAGFGRKIYAAGYDADDVLQEVYKGILARNNGKCPWDPNKSSFGHYVHMVCGCVLSNFHRKQRRIRSFEQVGMKSLQAEGWQDGDVASASNLAARPTIEDEDAGINEAADDLSEYILDHFPHDNTSMLAIAIIPHVAAGDYRKKIAKELGVSMAALSRAVSLLRKATLSWHGSLT